MSSNCEVLVVGAGPTGLVAASQLARHGVRVRLIERASAFSDRSRAIAIQARTLELFENMGILDRFLEVGRIGTAFQLHVNGKSIFRVKLDAIPSKHNFVLILEQSKTEEILAEYARSCGVEIEREKEFVGLREEPHRIFSEVQTSNGPEEIESYYLVAADGAHSKVRQSLQVPFEGDKYGQDFILADVRLDWNLPDETIHVGFSGEGGFACFPFSDDEYHRIILLQPKMPIEEHEDISFDEFVELAYRFAPSKLKVSDPRWLTRFRLHHRMIPQYHSGRTFFAGDAAHIHSPVGGQGMNTGIQDSMNLAWKLALACRNQAQHGVLASYHEERHPIGKKLLRRTDRMFQFVASPSKLTLAVRNWLLPTVGGFLSSKESVRYTAMRFISQVGIRYSQSSIVEKVSYKPGEVPMPGERVPDVQLKSKSGDSTSLFANLSGVQHTLVLFSGVDPSDRVLHSWQKHFAKLDERFESLIEKLLVYNGRLESNVPNEFETLYDVSGLAHKTFGVTNPAILLVRPDWHIATRIAPAEFDQLMEYFRCLYRTRGRHNLEENS